jgi:hypothetical protein
MLANQLLSCQLNRRQIRLAYNTTYIPAMCYSLLPLNLTEEELNKIQQQALAQFVQKSGYEITFPRNLIYGPTSFGGLGFHNLYTESYKEKLKTINCHINSESNISKNIKININLCQIHAGRITPILESRDRLNYTQDNWFKGLRHFLIIMDGKLKIRNLWLPTLNRTNDQTIMQDNAQHITNISDWKNINNWRMYFQVTTISDITSISGKYILPQYFDKSNAKHFTSRTKIRWPVQNMPSITTFINWKNHLKTITQCNNTGSLKTPLKEWIVNPYTVIQTRYLLHNTKQHILIWNHELQWTTHVLHHETYGTGHYNRESTTTTLQNPIINHYTPIDLNTTTKFHTVKYDDFFIFITTTTQFLQNPTINFQHFLENQLWSYPIRPNIKILDQQLANKNTPMQLIICCDGGVKNNSAGFGISASINQVIFLETKAKLSDIYNEYTSHRAEAIGINYAIQISKALKRYQLSIHTQPPPITTIIYCDNKNIINITNKNRFTNIIPLKSFYTPDFDIIHSTANLLKTTDPTTTRILHIKGHQDQTKQTLSHPAQLNIRADTLATESLQIKKAHTSTLPYLFHSTLELHGKQVTSNYNQIIRKNHGSIRIRKYLQNKHFWNDTTIENVWWLTHEKAIYCNTPDKQIFLQKFIHNKLPTNERQHLYFPYQSNKCTSCKTTIESQAHILQCTTCPLAKEIQKNT